MKYLFLFLFSIVSIALAAQIQVSEARSSVRGNVYDEKTKEPVPYASVRLLQAADSAYVQGTSTDEKGKFRFTPKYGKYILEISFIGYKTFSQSIETSAKHPEFVLQELFLEEDVHLLDEAVVTAPVPDIVVKGDTIEYNASAYTSEQNAMLQDMIKSIPGMEIDASGNITANGKPVEKILIDGKEFFGNDIAMALSSLPANMVKKLQLFKTESETAKITGIKDKNPNMTLNLLVKEELKQSTMGDVKGGYGTDDRYANRLLVSRMKNDNQYSLVGDMSNIAENNNMSVGRDGEDINKNLGVNVFLQSSEKVKIGANARYSNNDNLLEIKSNTRSFLSTGDRISKQDMSNQGIRDNMNTGVYLQLQPDSLTSIFIRSSIGLSNLKTNQTEEKSSFVAGGDTTRGHSEIFTKGDGYNINNTVTVGRRLGRKGRNISFTLSQSLRNDNNNGTNYSLTTFGGAANDVIIDQITSTVNKNDNYGISFSYVEPLGKGNSLQLGYTYNQSNSDRDREALRKDEAGNYTVIDTAFTRRTKNNFSNQSFNLNFQSIREKYTYSAGLSIDPSRSLSRISIGDSILENLTQQVVNFSPNIHFTYNPKPNTDIDFNYSGSTSQPAVSQLSADTVLINALNKTYGNPNLKPGYSNNMNIYYRKSDYMTNRFFMLFGAFSYVFNNIVNYTKIDDKGNTVTTYRNVTGNMSANIGGMYNTPLRNKKFTVSNNLYTNYSRNIGYVNGERAITNNIVINEQASIKFRTDKVDTNMQAGFTYNISKNNLTNQQDKNVMDYKLGHSLIWNLPYHFSLQSNIDFVYFSGYQGDFKNSEILWNASLAKQILKGRKGTIRLQAFDILNDRNNLTRSVSNEAISDSRTNTVNRYVMLSFSYRFNIMKGASKDSGPQILPYY